MLKAQPSFTQWWSLAQKVYQHYLFESSQLPFEGGTAITSGLQVPKILKNLSGGVWVWIQEIRLQPHALSPYTVLLLVRVDQAFSH